MMRSMLTATTGLKTHQVMLDVTANNLANVNTVGYKGSRTTFQDQLAQTQRPGSSAGVNSAGVNASQVGLGVSLGAISNIQTGGSQQLTGGALDVAISGPGWLRVAQGVPTAGNPTAGIPALNTFNYTRAGDFNRNDAGYLVTRDGFQVIGKVAQDPGGGGVADCYIQIPSGATNVSIGPDGAVSFLPPAGYTQPAALPPIGPDGRAIAGFVSLSHFANEAGLERASNNRWMASQSSGFETAGTPGGEYGQTTSGVLEMSNVDMATEFTNMITAQRGFQANSRVISTTDQILETLVNLSR